MENKIARHCEHFMAVDRARIAENGGAEGIRTPDSPLPSKSGDLFGKGTYSNLVDIGECCN